ncbi:MAG TPA: hypothetical protein VIT91_03660 [Chthoniobacterales bacterium]
MSAWRRQAIEFLPEHKTLIEVCDTPMFLWTELHSIFHKASEEENIPLMRSLFGYARWCWHESRSRDTQTAALIGFYENIPSDRNHWWAVAVFVSRPDFAGLEQIFRYFLSDEQYEEFKTYYFENRAIIEKDLLKKKTPLARRRTTGRRG